jgi:hypothetical protein
LSTRKSPAYVDGAADVRVARILVFWRRIEGEIITAIGERRW